MSSTELDRTLLGRALCVVTGASRGFGRTVAREMSRCLKSGSALVIVARSADDLRTLQAELTESEAAAAGVVVKCVVADLGQVEGPESVVKASKEAFSEDMDHIILVNNAGRWSGWSLLVCRDKCVIIVSEQWGTWAGIRYILNRRFVFMRTESLLCVLSNTCLLTYVISILSTPP